MRKLEGKRLLRKPRRTWVGNIKLDLREIGWGGTEWIRRMFANTEMKLRFSINGKSKFSGSIIGLVTNIGIYEC